MIRFTSLLLAWLLLAGTAGAQQPFFFPPVGYPAVTTCSGAYVGPGDVVAGSDAWWGLRAYSCAYAAPGTNKGINIRRASDNTTTDIVIKSSGDLDTATAVTFCASTTCFVKTIYDQTGHSNDATNATNADQPTLVFSCLGSLPCMSSGGSPVYLLNANPATNSGSASSYSAVAERTGGLTSVSIINGNGTANSAIGFSSTAGNGRIYRTNVSTDFTMSSNAWHALQANLNGSSSTTNVDGASTTGLTVGTGTLASTATLFAVNNAVFFLIGRIAETGIWPGTGFTALQETNVCKNQQAYWGTGNFPATC